jgi:multiple antibiotic resistance protein
MDSIVGHGLTVFMGFFAIMNPIANTPVFLGLTANDTPAIKKRVAAKALLMTFAIIVVFCLFGSLIFSLFGITLPAFRITGGVLVALIGYQMLHGEQSSIHQPDKEKEGDLESALSIAVTPLAIPILGGPGTIATAMNYASTGGVVEMGITIGAFAILCVITYGFFVFGQRLVAFLGSGGLNVIT